MRKLIVVFYVFLAAVCCVGSLCANDYKLEFINALSGNDYSAAESIVNKNIDKMSSQDKRHMLNLSLTYSRGDTALRALELFKKHNIFPGNFDLYTAIDNNQNDAVVRFILNGGARANGEILLLAVEKQRFEFAKQFIAAGADVNYQYPAAKKYADGMTSLLHAAKNDNFDLVKLLVEHGADINAKNKDGGTALSFAQMNNNSQMSGFLIDNGANKNIGNVVRSQLQNQPQAQSPSQAGGIDGFLNGQLKEFQPGKYRLSKGNRDLQFTGNANYGNVGFIRNNRTYSGTYQINGANMIVILEGHTFVYNLDAGASFSGNGETWVRVGN